MPVTRETRHVVDLPTGTDATIIVEQPVPLQQRVPVLRADPHEKPSWPVKDGRARRLVPPRHPIRNKAQVTQHLGVLIAAFEEVEGFDPRRGHNGPSPALWIDDADYLQDVKSFLGELRRLNDFLSRPADNAKAEQAASLVARATTKFVESYAGALGKGAAALAVGAAATLLYNIGGGKEIVEPIWGQLKGSNRLLRSCTSRSASERAGPWPRWGGSGSTSRTF
jgi:hypothetical protein